MGCIQFSSYRKKENGNHAGNASSAPTTTSGGTTDSSAIWVTWQQKQLIRSTWTIVAPTEADYEQLGADVFQRIFERHDEVRQLFPFANETTSGSGFVGENGTQQHPPAFRNHAAAFVHAIGLAVEYIDDWDGRLTDTLLMLGANHSNTRGFTVRNFEAFAESLIYVWKRRLETAAAVSSEAGTTSGESGSGDAGVCCLDEGSLNDVVHAWETLFIFIMMKLRDGYQLMSRHEFD